MTELPKNYEKLIKNEKKHWKLGAEKVDSKDGEIPRVVPTVNAFVEAHVIQRDYFLENMEHLEVRSWLIEEINSKDEKTNIISLGCGTGDWEMELLKKCPDKIDLELLELDEGILEYAKKFAEANNLKFDTKIQDANKLELDPEKYDYIIVRSSLHHFLELEHIFTEINKALKEDGNFIVIGEVIGKNGHILYKETRDMVQNIMNVIPEKFRYNHNDKKTDKTFPNIDYSNDSFEGIRCQDIYPLLQEYFIPKEQVAFDAFLSFLLDFRYGPNYDLNNPLDSAVLNFIVQLDLHCVKNKILKPTSLWGIYGKKNKKSWFSR